MVNILVIDDERSIRNTLKEILEYEKFKVELAEHGAEGLDSDQFFGREISLKDYNKLHKILVRSTREERAAMPGMEPVRVEMIVAATIFVSFVIRACQIRHLHHSEFALKEGVISELVGI